MDKPVYKITIRPRSRSQLAAASCGAGGGGCNAYLPPPGLAEHPDDLRDSPPELSPLTGPEPANEK